MQMHPRTVMVAFPYKSLFIPGIKFMDRFFGNSRNWLSIIMAKDVNRPLRSQNIPSERDARSKHARRRKIGEQLKQLYDDVANEPIPDEFLKLLRDADEKSKPSEGE
ncbi:MAG: hypothetical protein MRY64_16600 [Hyphomonadaceae bacterium]|nr:hypothetical protein [Hyphomonadaceae bacterium]